MKRLIIIASVLFLILIFWKRATLIQEGNPLNLFVPILKLETNQAQVVQFSDFPPKYIFKTNSGPSALHEYMQKTRDQKLIDQMGSGLLYENTTSSLFGGLRMFSRRYMTFTVWEEHQSQVRNNILFTECMKKVECTFDECQQNKREYCEKSMLDD